MSLGRWFRKLQLLYFAQPAADRSLYRHLLAAPVSKIVELGIDLPGRTDRLLEIAAWSSPELAYTGIDLFEARPEGQPKLTLKEAFAALKRPGVQARLVPGDPQMALARVANSLAGTDLLLIGPAHDEAALASAWVWIPRMLTAQSIVLQFEQAAGRPTAWRSVPRDEIAKRCEAAKSSRRRAA